MFARTIGAPAVRRILVPTTVLGLGATARRGCQVEAPWRMPLRTWDHSASIGRFSTRSASTTTTTSTAPATSSGSFLAWYEGHLQKRPVVTKMITGSVLWGLGDAVAQVVPPFANGTPLPDYDVIRTGRAVFFGFAIHAPLSHLHFNFLEWITVRSGITGYRIPFFKAFLEQFVYWSWISNSIYFAAMGAMQGLNGPQIYDRICDVLWETQLAQWAFWIPVQLINFQFTPVRHQLNVVLLTSIAWTALLSAWYPPLDPKENAAAEEPTA
jgi:protein Mpv17